jgi:fatty-acyl-CoA synthase
VKALMGQQALTVRTIFDRLRTVHAGSEVVDALASGSTRTTYGDMAQRVLRLVTVLRELGVQPGDRVATFANNSSRHVELYYAVPLAGGVLHMVNIRLHDDQLEHVVADAGDTVLFVDDDLIGRLAPLVERMPSVRTYVRLGKGDCGDIDGILDGESLVAEATPTPLEQLPELAEDDACGMCHTSGTTGMPKAVVYSHRSTYLHAMAACMVDALALSESERVLPVVPLFHACGWGLPYAAPLTGAELVLAGADTSPANLARIVETERVTWAAGVPTIWTGLLPLAQSGAADLSSLRTLAIGGSATPLALIEAYDALGIEIVQIWGMTETSPVAASSRPRRRHRGLTAEQLREVRARTGTVFAGLEARVVAEDGAPLPWDGASVGELECRGPMGVHRTTAGGAPPTSSATAGSHRGHGDDGAPTANSGSSTAAKDLVKSGGEWISSVELEGAVLAHPAVPEAAGRGDPVAEVGRAARGGRRAVRRRLLGAERAAGLPAPGRVAKGGAGRAGRRGRGPKTSVGKYDKKAIAAQLSRTAVPAVRRGRPRASARWAAARRARRQPTSRADAAAGPGSGPLRAGRPCRRGCRVGLAQ